MWSSKEGHGKRLLDTIQHRDYTFRHSEVPPLPSFGTLIALKWTTSIMLKILKIKFTFTKYGLTIVFDSVCTVKAL